MEGERNGQPDRERGGEAEAEPPPSRIGQARATLFAGAVDFGLALTPDQLDAFEHYAALIREGKRTLSLTALVDPIDVAVKHFLDSLSVLPLLPAGPLRLIDVGTGAGFPAVPLLLVRPEIEATLLEATAKKAGWLTHALDRLRVRGAIVLAARAEVAAHDAAHRGRYDVAVARAVAPLAVLCELCLPFLRPGGRFIALKSAPGATVEVPQAAGAIASLSGRLVEVRPVGHPDLPNRVLVVVEQLHPAPPAYPRRPGMPAKRPL